MRKHIAALAAVVAATVIGAAPATGAPPATATGGWYDEAGYHAIGEEGDDACKGKGGIIATRDGTTGIITRPDGTSYWFHTMVYTCGDGSEISVEVSLGDLSEYVPDPPPPANPPPCEGGYYTDDGWVECPAAGARSS